MTARLSVGIVGGVLAWMGLATGAPLLGDEPPLRAVPFQQVHLRDGFWSPRIETNRTATIQANLHQCEISGRLRNFDVAAGRVKGKHEGFLYNDSDVYKMLEGIAYALTSERDPSLEARADKIVDSIAAAQQPDGYLNTYFTLVEPANRWKNIQYGHELYCAGHLFEAAVAYFQATGKRQLLDVAGKFADHIDDTFGPGKRRDACGHEEIELALVKLYGATGERRYLDLAKFFLDVRGTREGRFLFGEYAQDHLPIRQQTEVCGHAVRAMYLYSAMTDVAGATGDKGLTAAMDSIWHDVVDRKMYVTGGIGPSASNEGFTVPFDLPNDSAYAETCAAIGMALWNHRLFLTTGESKYADVLERVVYNGLLSGVSLSGDRFFYTNPLGSRGRHHRVPWFDCSCCPTNVVRYIPGIGERCYAQRENGIWTVLYMGGEAKLELPATKVELVQRTGYPWSGEVRIEVKPALAGAAFDLHLRIPDWCDQGATLTVNGVEIAAQKNDAGFVTVSRAWQAGDTVQLNLPMEVRRTHADPRVPADEGRVALMRGPVVYCLEGVDNGGRVRNLCLPVDSGEFEAGLKAEFDPDFLGGCVKVSGRALSVSFDKDSLVTREISFTAVPYSTWDNRSPGEMVVWMAEQPERAEAPGMGEFFNGEWIASSYVFAGDSLAAVNDGVLPKTSNDHDLPRMTWWDHKGGTEWIGRRTKQPREISSAKAYWFDDTGRGECRAPKSWRLLWRDGREWRPVELRDGQSYGTALDRFNEVEFEPVTTRELRLEVELQPEVSSGILEWQVQ